MEVLFLHPHSSSGHYGARVENLGLPACSGLEGVSVQGQVQLEDWAGDLWGRRGTKLKLWDSQGSAPGGAQSCHPCGQELPWTPGPMRLQDTLW